jgi:hypothetical protein
MLRLWSMRFLLLVAAALSAAMTPVGVAAQDDSKETPLWDIARNLRKKAPAQPVIDDDNFTEVMQQAESRRGFGASLRFLMSGEDSMLRVSAPDVTCSLSFSSDLKSLLSRQYSEMGLPAGDLARLEGHALIQGDALTVSIHNGTDWHVSEIAVAFTILNKSGMQTAAGGGTSAESASQALTGPEDKADRKPDTTVIYRMRGVGVPWSVTTFSSRLEVALASGSEWHWAIVEAKGYPPESYPRSVSQMSAESDQSFPVNAVPNLNPPASKTGELTPVSKTAADKPQLIPSANPQQ